MDFRSLSSLRFPRQNHNTRSKMQALPPLPPLFLPSPPPPPKLLPAVSAHRTAATITAQRAPLSVVDNDGDTPAAAFWDYQFLFLSQRAESAEPIPLPTVEGAVPADFPRGTYYLTGPGMFSDDHGSTVRPLDGHGYLRAFDFRDSGEVMYSARYVETAAHKEEQEEEGGWRFTHRGPFSVLRGGRRVGNVKVMKNVANTSVLRWGGRLLCLWEGGDPYEIDEQSLDTIGILDLIGRKEESHCEDNRSVGRRGGALGVLAELGIDVAATFLKPILHGLFQMPPKRLLSHYKIDAQRNRLLVLSCNAEDMLLPRSNFTFYEFDSNFSLKQKKEYVIPDQFMIHDWAFTDSHYILIGNRIKLDVPGSLRAVSGLSPMISALSVNPSQPTSPIYLLPRFSEGTKWRRDWKVPIEAPPQLWLIHVGNAFEETDSDGSLMIHMQTSVCSYQWFDFRKLFGYNWQNGKLDPGFMNAAKGKEEEAMLPHLVNVIQYSALTQLRCPGDVASTRSGITPIPEIGLCKQHLSRFGLLPDANQISIVLGPESDSRQCSVAEPSNKWSKPADFPAINQAYTGRRNSFIYAATTSGSRQFLPHFPFDTVAKLNCSDGSVASWWAGSRRFIGEPIFVPRGTEEDDGYILVVEYAVWKQRCYLVVLDARRIGRTDAVVTKLEVPKHLSFPLGFHGFWANR